PDPRRHDRRVHAARTLDDPAHRADGPISRHAVDPLAMSAITSPGPGADAPVPAGLGQLDAGRFDRRRTDGAGFADTIRSLRTALLLGWRIESNWTDP